MADGQTATIGAGQASGMDGLVVALQAVSAGQTAIATDVTAMRSDVSKALTRLEVIEAGGRAADDFHRDVEARVRVLEARPVTPADHEGRLRALEKFRYTVGGLALAGGAVAGWIAEWAAQHVHG